MDEFAVAQEVLSTVLQTEQAKQGKKILKIKVKAGVLKMISPEQLQSAFDILSNGTILQKAVIDLEEVPGELLEVESIEIE